jgi:hypothetical protein
MPAHQLAHDSHQQQQQQHPCPEDVTWQVLLLS